VKHYKSHIVLLCALVVILSGIVVISDAKSTVHADVTPRFEHIYEEYLDHGIDSADFEVYHDKVTGQELVCVEAHSRYDANSCYLTGRKW
jgi:hypothetical protein